MLVAYYTTRYCLFVECRCE